MNRLKEAEELQKQAEYHLEQGAQLIEKLGEIHRKSTEQAMREQEDKLINRKQALELLWFDSYPSLRSWERKMKPLGYLQFENDKIKRSKVLEFIDDHDNGTIHKQLDKLKRRY